MINYPDLVEKMHNCYHCIDICNPNPYHTGDFDIWTHTCMVFQNALTFKGKYSGALELCALLHDVGKVVARVQEDNKTRFKCHEAISSYVCTDIVNRALKEGYIASAYVDKILAVIALHGKLYEIKPEEVKNYFDKSDWILFQILADFCWCDANGRFASKGQDKYFDRRTYDLGWSEVALERKEVVEKDKNLIVLVGPPCSGKSTWVKNNLKDYIRISRDALLEGMFKDRGSYSDIFKSLTEDEQKSIDIQLMKEYKLALNAGENIVIDMTNMSKKSRAKFLNGYKELKNYNKHAKVFFISEEGFSRRNEMRSFSGKSIPHYLYLDMVKRFTFPLKDEFDYVQVFK